MSYSRVDWLERLTAIAESQQSLVHPSILRHSGILGPANEAVLRKLHSLYFIYEVSTLIYVTHRMKFFLFIECSDL